MRSSKPNWPQGMDLKPEAADDNTNTPWQLFFDATRDLWEAVLRRRSTNQLQAGTTTVDIAYILENGEQGVNGNER